MSRPAAHRLPRSAAARALLAGLAAACCLLSGAARAGRPVHVYEVDVDGQSTAAVQNAMREALVRATGRRESADDPALAGIVNTAPRFVKAYAKGPHGESQVVFGAAAVEQAIAAAGRSVWDRTRPFTLVVLAPPRSRGAQDAARAELERVAAERGLPISLLPLAVDDDRGTPRSGAELLQEAQRYGADQILVGRAAESPDAALQWTLFTPAATESWSGTLAAGIDHTVDFLVPQQGGSVAQAEGTVRVRVEGVTSLGDYAGAERLLESVPGVHRANLDAAEPDNVTFEVTVRGGAAALEQGLSGSARLQRRGVSDISGASVGSGGFRDGAALVYRYQPQG